MPKTGSPSTHVAVSRHNLTYSKVDALYACCNLFYKENGDGASTVSCPKANLLRCAWYSFQDTATLTFLQAQDEAALQRHQVGARLPARARASSSSEAGPVHSIECHGHFSHLTSPRRWNEVV